VTLMNITGSLRDFGRVDGPAKSTVANLAFKKHQHRVNKPRSGDSKREEFEIYQVKINGVALHR